MHLVEVAQDNTKMVRGYEHHVFVCSGCGEVERRLVFNKTEKPATGRNVKIICDHSPEAVFSAKDTASGMVVMRHQNRQRLQELCEWIGWRVVDGAPSGSDGSTTKR